MSESLSFKSGLAISELLLWAITGRITDTECPIVREEMWRHEYIEERGACEWFDLGGEA